MSQLPLLGPGDDADEDPTTDRPAHEHANLDPNADNSGNPLSCKWMINERQCPNTYDTVTDLSKHCSVHYSEECDRICYWRGCTSKVKEFSKRKNLREHVRTTHLNLRRFQCDICKKWSRTLSDLKRHKETHGTACKKCNEDFGNRRLLADHMKTHHPKHICPICRRPFNRAFNIQRHWLRKHSEKKPANQETSTEREEHMKTDHLTGGQHCDESVSKQVSVTEALQDSGDHTIGADHSHIEQTTTTDDGSPGQEDNSNQMSSNNGNNHGRITRTDYNQDINLHLYPKEDQQGHEYRDLSKL